MFIKPGLLFSYLILFISTLGLSQARKATVPPKKPKLVVGIVVDQMRWDYLYRFNELYQVGGFKRLLGEGFSCENTLIPYMPTYTAPGHTCVYTGSIPAIHGIVGNGWYEKSIRSGMYCTDDSTVRSVGTSTDAGRMSPQNMWTTTMCDELRLSNNFKSKVIGIALKDRGSILPAGHSANAAYWYDDKIGKWITSTHYMKELPAWVNEVNARDMPSVHMSKDWNTMLPMDRYNQSTADGKPYEKAIPGEETVTFPHKLSSITGAGKYSTFKYTPFAMGYTFDFAKDAISHEKLGSGNVTDFLAVSISSTDYIGHNFGPNSVEVEDTYLRLDQYLADFLKFLDVKLGTGNYMVFLTADHAVAHIPGFLEEHNLPGGTFSLGSIYKTVPAVEKTTRRSNDNFSERINQAVENKLGIKKAVLSVENYQVYLDDSAILKAGKTMEEVTRLAISIIKQNQLIVNAVPTSGLNTAELPEPQRRMFENGFNPKRSGDIVFTFKPGYFDGGDKGTTHGLWNPYDAHIPLVFYGWNVNPGKTYRETYMTDIAPTVSAMLHIQMPNGNVGKVVTEVFKPAQ